MSTPSNSVSYSTKDDNNKLRRGPWTLEEDDLLVKHIANHGEGRWNLLAMSSGLRRTGKSCRLRWLNYLKPDIKRGNLTSEEQLLIFELHSKWGNRWSKIAQHLPGRTDNEIKNYWRTRIQKQARHLKFDTAIHLPLDGVSHYSTTGTIPTQVSYQGDCMNIEGVLNCLDQCEKNSVLEHNNGLCISSSESANMSNTTQPLEYTTNQFEALDNSEFGICAYEGYHINNTALNLTTTMVGEGLEEYQTRDCQISQSNWLDEEFVGSTSWNMNELWQVRNIQQ